MGAYLESKGFVRGSKVAGFKFVNVEFKWQGTGYSAFDCGVYMMIHMLLFNGKLFDCALGEMDVLNLVRAEVVSILILSDHNKVRESVRSRITQFRDKYGQGLNPLENLVSNVAQKRSLDDEEEITYSKRPRVAVPPPKRVEGSPVVNPVAIQAESSPAVVQASAQSSGSQPLSAVRSRPRGGGDGLGCSIDCGAAGTQTLVVSTFLRNNQSLVRGIRSRRKHAVDYCLLDDYNFENSESISWYSRHATLRRSDIMTMLPEVVMSPVVIESWAVLLNHLESAEHLLPRMAFFGIRHMVHRPPLLPAHKASNVLTRSNDITDRLYHIWDTFIQDCDKTFNLNAEFIFVPVNIGGHFACMMYIFDVRGLPFEHPDLERKRNRRYLVVELVATLVLADINVNRDIFEAKLNGFIAGKEDLWAKLQKKRKIKAVLSKK
ncbi:uncharacterized protein LOC141617442 [Silene latifolia]|uniref:uncharacterized protein LOC141617442 n=1 Tax=Silene latifolia TaxID=37657 RepID=UPI003D7717B3